jgi:predicted dehydrogenase/threonine dehydrogenase-like Zn-dependent dehydrogenase
MKQVLQDLRSGETRVDDVPAPGPRTGHLLIGTTQTLVSAGTERMLVEFGKANLVDKARQQPDKVRQVLAKVRTDGLMPTLEAVRHKLDQPLPTGYCNVGRVIDAGGIAGMRPGDRVVSNGKHAEVVSVPINLCARIPDNVDDESAAFTVIGAIGLQGIRLIGPTLGETVAVMGLGLIGLMTVQLLRAHGCRVIGLDFDRTRLDLARGFGAETIDLSRTPDPVAVATDHARGRGVDAVIITASTKSNDPVHQAAQMCRKRGRIVLVGVVGLELSRADFYEKELSFQVSCSYGPGRYDPFYEDKGNDYPVGFVRWTEQRNFEAVLDMMSDGRLDVRPLITHRFPIVRAADAYVVVGGSEPSLGILLEFPRAQAADATAVQARSIRLDDATRKPAGNAIGFIGAGNYAGAILIPAFKQAGANLKTVVSNTGVSAVHAGRKNGFEIATTDIEQMLGDPAIESVVIATRHDTHAALTCRALTAGRHVFVEKPLAMQLEELARIEAALAQARAAGREPLLMVGFNRRFSPHIQKAKSLLAGARQPKAMVMTVNAGAIPGSHWTQDDATGGGRIVGEACHFIDLLRYLADSAITGWQAVSVAQAAGAQAVGGDDVAMITLTFADGSIGTIHYLANGHKGVPKERLEVFTGGCVLQLDNFRRLDGHGFQGFKKFSGWRQDKGQRDCAQAFVKAVGQGGPAPIPLDELLEVSRVTIAIASHLRGEPARA